MRVKSESPYDLEPDPLDPDCNADPDKNLGLPSCSIPTTPNPIIIGTGNKFQQETDYVGAGPFPLRFSRSYNSQQKGGGAVGYGWRYSYGGYISVTSSTKTTVYHPDGKVLTFTLSSGQWKADADITDTLVQLPNATGWKYTTADGTIETYDAAGKRTSFTNRTGLTQTYTFSDGTKGANGGVFLDANGNPTATVLPAGYGIRVTDASGRTLSFGYDAAGHIVKLTDPAGGVYLYKYDESSSIVLSGQPLGNNLTSVTYPDGRKRIYGYNEQDKTGNTNLPHALTGIVDENSVRYASYWYDAKGRAVKEEHGPSLNQGIDRYQLTYTTDISGNLTNTIVTDPLGTARSYNFTPFLGVVKSTAANQPGGSGCGPASSLTTHDAHGNSTSWTDFNGNTTLYTFDLTRNLETSRTEAAGTAQARTITTNWHPSYRLPVQISEPGRTTAFTYDATGNLLQKTVAAGSQARTWSYTYNAWGQVTSADGPRGDVADVTRYGYDTQGNLATITNALGHVTQIIAYDANGKPLTLLDPNLIATQLTYDARGRLTRKAVESEVTTYGYDGVGQLVQLAQPDGSILTYTYDPAHRLVGIADSQGNRIGYILDATGNRLQENVTDPAGQLARTRAQAWDSLGRLAQVLDSQNHATRYAYDANGNPTSSADANGATTRNSYDALNRTLDPLNGATQTQYDALDQVTRVTDPINVTTAYQVDGLGNVGIEASPDSGSTASTHDSAGNLVTRTDATGTTLNYAYDALNRLTRISGAAGPLITYTWDGYALGKLAQIQDASGGTQYQYDPYSRLSAKTQTLGSLSFTVGYAWNPVGQLTQVTTPSGNQIGYAYAHGKINAITVNGQPLLTNISHAPFGPLSGWTWGNGLPHLRAHGLDGEIQLIESAIAQNYSYDAAGQLTQIHQWSQLAPPQYDTVNSYGYDAGGRLTQANTQAQLPTGPYAATQGYAYDANGNRSQLSSNSALTHYAYSANRLTNSTGASAKTYTYDAAGRMTGDGNYTYGYNALGRLVTVQSGSRNIGSYAYNALGQRVSKTGVRFVHDEFGHLLGEYDQRGNLVQELVWLEGLPVASLRPGPKGGKTTVAYYIHPDHLGTPRQITDSNNQIVWRWDSPDPFGSALPDENPDNGKRKRNGVFEFNLRFAGQYYDRETGRSDNWWRVYDSGTGRYTTSDPIGLAGGVNRYAYVLNDPIGLSDPFGLKVYWNGHRKPSQIVVDLVEQIDECNSDRDVIVTSTIRDEKTNKAAGGKPKSRHLTGDAADIYVPGQSSGETAAQAVGVGAMGVGTYDRGHGGHTHIDGRLQEWNGHNSKTLKNRPSWRTKPDYCGCSK